MYEAKTANINNFWKLWSIILLICHLFNIRYLIGWITCQNVQKLQILPFCASYIASILEMTFLYHLFLNLFCSRVVFIFWKLMMFPYCVDLSTHFMMKGITHIQGVRQVVYCMKSVGGLFFDLTDHPVEVIISMIMHFPMEYSEPC